MVKNNQQISPIPKASEYLNLAAFQKGLYGVGPGCRDTLWVQGCSIHCQDCANERFILHVLRRLLPVEQLIRHFFQRRNQIDGITVSGGEPTEQAKGVGRLLDAVSELGLSTLVYTGRTYETLLGSGDTDILKLLKNTDVLIDGAYVAKYRDETLKWRGSSNQRLLGLSEG